MKKSILVFCFLGLFGTSCEKGNSGSTIKDFDEARNDEKAKAAALILYTANASGIQGSDPYASVDWRRDANGATEYTIAIEDSNEDGDSWTAYHSVIVLYDGKVTRVRHSERDLEDASTPFDQSAHLALTTDLARQLFKLNHGDVEGNVDEGDGPYEYTRDVSNRITVYAQLMRLKNDHVDLDKIYRVRISNKGLFATEIEEDNREE
ncbi:MAG: hypothetical protein AB7T49_18375 [Oligoflexales bacterium]